MFVLSWQHRNLKCSDTRIRLARAWEAYFYRSEGGEKKVLKDSVAFTQCDASAVGNVISIGE